MRRLNGNNNIADSPMPTLPARTLLLVLTLSAACVAQSRPDLYECEGCEAIREGAPATMSSVARIASVDEPGDRLILTGTVRTADGRKPAAGVIVYVHHTNTAGRYPNRPTDTGWARRHGYLRGWVLTDSTGTYRFETIRPGSYPGRPDPAHIHFILKEPGRQEYWIEDVVFTDDTLVTPAYRGQQSGRGGSGIVTPRRDPNGVWIARRDITLER